MTPTAHPDLQGLRDALLGPHPSTRNEEGWLFHPSLPLLDDSTDLLGLLHAFGLDVAVTALEDESQAMLDRYMDTSRCDHWTPEPPTDEDWRLIEIYDTEDGPRALFVRPESQQRVARTLTRRALALVLAERQRQIEDCGHRPQDDDFYVSGQLAAAAASYALSSSAESNTETPESIWPWNLESFKPRSPLDDLARAAALLTAEIERHIRAGRQSTTRGERA